MKKRVHFNDSLAGTEPEKLSLPCSETYRGLVEDVKNQNRSIFDHSVKNSPVKPPRGRMNSLETTVLQPRRPFASFPSMVSDSGTLVEPPILHETKWTSVYRTPSEPVKSSDDDYQSYSSALKNWTQITWEGVKSMPTGTWIQYTSNVYPDYKTRKKTVCIIGNTIYNDIESVTAWSIMGKDTKDHNELTNESSEKLCRKGYHLQSLNSNPNSPFVDCEYCKCRGWRLSKGSSSQARLFYASPWSISREEKKNGL